MIDEIGACVSGKPKRTAADSLEHKRYETSGRLYHEMFAGLLTRFLEDAISAIRAAAEEKNMEHVLETFETYFHGAQHTKFFNGCLATGKWKLPHSQSEKERCYGGIKNGKSTFHNKPFTEERFICNETNTKYRTAKSSSYHCWIRMRF